MESFVVHHHPTPVLPKRFLAILPVKFARHNLGEEAAVVIYQMWDTDAIQPPTIVGHFWDAERSPVLALSRCIAAHYVERFFLHSARNNLQRVLL